MDYNYKNIKERNPNKKRKILIVFNDMIADMLSNKKLNVLVTELFIRGRISKISLVFILQSYIPVLKVITLNSTRNVIMKISNKPELQQIVFNRSSCLSFKTLRIFEKNVLKNNILF